METMRVDEYNMAEMRREVEERGRAIQRLLADNLRLSDIIDRHNAAASMFPGITMMVEDEMLGWDTAEVEVRFSGRSPEEMHRFVECLKRMTAG